MNKLPQPLRYHGGKSYLAKKIVDLMPEHTHYLEPFAGGLSVLLRKPYEGVSETVNDLNGDLMNFWYVLTDPTAFHEFYRRIEAIPLSEEVFKASKEVTDGTAVERAVGFFIRMRQSRQGLGTSYTTPTRRTRGGMNEQVSAWLTAVKGLPEIYKRMIRVEVLNRPATEVIQRRDHVNLLVYADPPYMRQTRSSPNLYGNYEMTYGEHEELLNVLSQMQGKFILSGYDSPLYREYEQNYSWSRFEFDVPNNSSGKKAKERKTEIVWTNFSKE